MSSSHHLGHCLENPIVDVAFPAVRTKLLQKTTFCNYVAITQKTFSIPLTFVNQNGFPKQLSVSDFTEFHQ
jgi:hypothetical protein